MAIFNLSGKMPVFNTWLISKVVGLIIAGSIILINLDEIPSSPQLFFEGRVCIVFLIVSSSMFSKIKYCIYMFIQIILEIFSAIVFNITCKSLSYVGEKLIKFVSNMLFICMCHTIFRGTYTEVQSNFFRYYVIFIRIISRTWLPLDAAILHCSDTFIC